MSHVQYTHLLCCLIPNRPPICRPMPTGNARPFFCHCTDAPHMSNTSIFDGPSSMTTDQTPAQSQYPISHPCPPLGHTFHASWQSRHPCTSIHPSNPPQHCCYRPNCAKCPTLRKMDFPSLNGFPPFSDLRLHMSVFHSVKSQFHLHPVHTPPQNYSAFHPSNHPFRKTPVYAHSAQRYFAQLYSPFNSVCQTTHEYTHQMPTHAHSIDPNPLFAQTAPTESVGIYTWRSAHNLRETFASEWHYM